MSREKIRKLAFTALFAALVFVTTLLSIPTPLVGNVNLGDSMVLLAAWVLGGGWAMAAAGLGAALCDMVSGYILYAPATLIIKAGMAALVVLLKKCFEKTPLPRKVGMIFSFLCAELLMIAGYFAYEALFLKFGLAAAANIPFNAIQGACGILAAVLLETILDKTSVIQRLHLQ